jgi:threonyl-tRNA synthetase
MGYAESVAARLEEGGLRVQIDRHSDKLGAKIRNAQMQKIPFMLIVGDRDVEQGVVSVRHRTAGDLGSETVDDFLAQAQQDIDDRAVREWPLREGSATPA